MTAVKISDSELRILRRLKAHGRPVIHGKMGFELDRGEFLCRGYDMSLLATKGFVSRTKVPRQDANIIYSYYLSDAGEALLAEEKHLIQALPDEGRGDVEYFPGAVREEIGTVAMQSIVGQYASVDLVPEWAWLEQQAYFVHAGNDKTATPSVFEVVLRLNSDQDHRSAPAALLPVFKEAFDKDLAYIIFKHAPSTI